MSAQLYCLPSFPRGTGLGNRLFLWARCTLFADRYGAQMISPLWFRPALGQLVRGGVDYRCYLHQVALFNLFVTPQNQVGLIPGLLATASGRKVSEGLVDDGSIARAMAGVETLRVDFDQALYRFTELNGHHQLLLARLLASTRPTLLAAVDAFAEPQIGINVRCGNDFKEPPEDPDYSWVGWLQKTPISWFVETLELMRAAAGYSVPAVVVSDGTERQLGPLLALPNVKFLRPGNAITDLLTLAKSRVLLASGSSTFSAWASFLGQMPTVTAPGHPMGGWDLAPTEGQFLGAFNPRTPDDFFLQQVSTIFSGFGS